VKNEHVRRFYATEALRAGWSMRQNDTPKVEALYQF
jgi:predicted nuclease of restriction endonuclease-like (RecB) superfamily